MNIHFLKLLPILLLMSLLLPISAMAAEAPDALSDETIKRVYDEVLSESITSEEDVLKVVLAQYENRESNMQQSSTFSARSTESSTEENESVPIISQILEKTVDEDGTVTYLVADTGLLVVDESNEVLSTEKLINQGYANFDAYDITAQHTVYYYYRHTPNVPYENEEVKIYKQRTYLYYYGNYQATRLEHYYYPVENALRTEYFINSYSNPSANTSYIDYPTSPDWVPAFTQSIAGFISTANIYCGSESVTIDVLVNSSTVSDLIGTW